MGGIGSFISSALGAVSGGLLGGPKIPKQKKAREQFGDPNRGARIAAARKQRAALTQGRSSFKIDLAESSDEQKQVRGGITIS